MGGFNARTVIDGIVLGVAFVIRHYYDGAIVEDKVGGDLWGVEE